MPGAIFRPGGMIGGLLTSSPTGPNANGVFRKRNLLSEIEFHKRRNVWPTTDGDINIAVVDYLYDAANPYSYPRTGGSIWYDLLGYDTNLFQYFSYTTKNSNNGTFAGDTVWSTDGGGSLYFDGTGDWVTSFPYSLSNAASLRTVGIFFKPTATGSQGLIGNRNSALTNTQGWSLMINRTSNGQLNLVHCNAGATPIIDYAAGITTNTWYHATYTYDRANLDAYLYLNGSQVASNLNFGVDASNPNFNGVIGNRSSDLGGPFTGYIGVVYISSTVLSAAEVTTMHNLFKARFGL